MSLAIYNQVCDIVHNMNRVYKLQIFVMLWYTFVNGLLTIFMIIKLWGIEGTEVSIVRELTTRQVIWNILIGQFCLLMLTFAVMAKKEVSLVLLYCTFPDQGLCSIKYVSF